MTPDTPIYGKEGQELEKTISKLIGRHNVLCDVEEFFAKNKVANEYFKEAAYYLSQAAEKNDAEGQWQLGWMYIRGECFDKDEQKGREYFEKAAERDFSPAMVALGICNEEGIGVFKNKRTAIHWYEKAAAQNNEEAIAALKRLR